MYGIGSFERKWLSVSFYVGSLIDLCDRLVLLSIGIKFCGIEFH